MSNFRYVSVFSGIGGLEHPGIPPLLICEKDTACQSVLKHRYQGVEVAADISNLINVPVADAVVGGWPCQDLSSAGTLGGIAGHRSGLFFEMLRVADLCRAHTLVGENVPNLLTINRGRDFQVVLDTLLNAGFRFVAWRVLNARSFGLPQERRRLFIVASKDRERAMALHAAVPKISKVRSRGGSSGFYWTGGKRSICFSRGYVPALKIGATDNNGRAPVAIMFGDRVRKLSAMEFLRLQGFSSFPTDGLAPSTILRMAGNAVPAPMGEFVLSAVSAGAPSAGLITGFGIFSTAGLMEDRQAWVVDHKPQELASNLTDFLDLDSDELLSSQAAAGLIVRSVRSGHSMPRELFDVLSALAENRGGKLHPSRGNSFDALDQMTDAVARYRESLSHIEEYRTNTEDEDGFDSESVRKKGIKDLSRPELEARVGA